MKLNFKDQGGTTIFYLNVIGQEANGDWLIAMVNFSNKGFSASFKISLMLHDLYTFLDQLKSFQKLLKGNAALSNIEDNLNVTLSTDGIGHIAINGILQHTYNPDLKLFFEINSDQTFLPDLISECTKILEHYHPK